MDPVVNLGVQMNLGPSPNNDFAFGGADLFGVRSWKAILDGIVEILGRDRLDIEQFLRRRTAL